MKFRMRFLGTAAPILAAAALAATGCRAYQINSTIENRTGSPIQLLEVDYPEASFGVDKMAAGADFHYKFTVTASGQLKIHYTVNRHQVQIPGPTLSEHQHGRLQIILLPGARAKFVPELTPPS